MTGFDVRLLKTDDELRAANTLFRGAIHVAAATDDEWAQVGPSYWATRTFGVFGPELVGTARAGTADLVVPGGARLPVGTVCTVGVRVDHTRRGLLRALMDAQLTDLAGNGIVLAALHASEGSIYERFGYGIAGRKRTLTVDRRLARLRPDAPADGEVTAHGLDDAMPYWREVFDRLPDTRPGRLIRPDWLWDKTMIGARRSGSPAVTAVHRGPDGPDGYALYHVEDDGPGTQAVVKVEEMFTATAAALAGLWRFLLGIDLVGSVTAASRPLDEPVELLFTDHRRCTVDRVRIAVHDPAALSVVDTLFATPAAPWCGTFF